MGWARPSCTYPLCLPVKIAGRINTMLSMGGRNQLHTAFGYGVVGSMHYGAAHDVHMGGDHARRKLYDANDVYGLLTRWEVVYLIAVIELYRQKSMNFEHKECIVTFCSLEGQAESVSK